MKNNLSRAMLVIFDLLAIVISISLAYLLELLLFEEHANYVQYIDKLLIYLIIVAVLFYEGIYTKRYDFWHESRQIIKSLAFSFLLVMSYLALTKNVGQFSNVVIVLAFIFMAFFIPLFKNILKKTLFALGLWQRKAKIYGKDKFIKNEIFKNRYLGYIDAEESEAQTIFINSNKK